MPLESAIFQLMKPNPHYLKRLILGFYLVCFLPFVQADHSDFTVINNGTLNLSQYQWQEGERIKLDGHWGFYWNQLRSSDQWEAPKAPFFHMPSTWDADGHSGYSYPGFGAATFTVEIKGLDPSIEWALLIPEITTAFRLIVNGVTSGEGGVVSLNAADFQPYRGMDVYQMPKAKDGNYRIILQVANFLHFNGGPWQTIELVPAQMGHDAFDRQMVIEAVVATLMLIMGILLIVEYAIDPRDRTGMWLGLLAIDLGIRLSINGSGPVYWMLDFEPSWSVHISIAYVTMVIAPFLFFGWFKNVFAGDFPKKLFQIGSAPFLVSAAFCIVAPPFIFTAYLKFFSYLLFASMIVGIWFLIVVVVKKRRSAWLLLLGVSVLCFCTVHDMMVNNQIISGSRWVQFGFLVFVLSQVTNFLALRVWQRRQIEVLSKRLQRTNADLERRVQLRTQDLSEKADELSAANEKLQHLANVDSLTGILNRRAFIEQLEDVESWDGQYSVLLIDLDHFKQVNDNFGHGAGDEVLREMGQLLNKLRRSQDSVGRIGGEEFAVLLLDCDRIGAESFAKRINAGLGEIRFPDWPELGPITSSIGVAISGVRKVTGMAILNAADEAMYHIKKKGRNGYHVVELP